MTLRDVNCEVERLNNKLDKLLRDKELLETMTDPKSTDFEKITVDGGKHGNILEAYILKKDLPRWKNLDEEIKRTQDEIKINMDWIDKELKILNKYNKVEQLIVYYKEISTKEYTWQSISNLVHYSEAQCRRIYRAYKAKRNI